MAGVRDLVMQLAENMGLDGLSFDADGLTGIQFDDLAVNIHADEEAGEMTIFLKIGDVPDAPAARAAVYSYMLKNDNFSRNTGGGVLGVDADEKAAYFSHRFATASLTPAHLERIVEAFLNLADSFVAGFREAALTADGGAAATVPGGMRA